jgi:hypothetical protein
MGLVPRGPILQRGADVDDETPVALAFVFACCSCTCGQFIRFNEEKLLSGVKLLFSLG